MRSLGAGRGGRCARRWDGRNLQFCAESRQALQFSHGDNYFLWISMRIVKQWKSGGDMSSNTIVGKYRREAKARWQWKWIMLRPAPAAWSTVAAFADGRIWGLGSLAPPLRMTRNLNRFLEQAPIHKAV